MTFMIKAIFIGYYFLALGYVYIFFLVGYKN